MLFEVLEILAQQVEAYTGKATALANVAFLEDSHSNSFEDSVVVSLVNLSEENTMKNWPNTKVVNGKNLLKQPIINLNLYVMFCANFGDTKYATEISTLSKIIEFFQGKKVFTQSNTVYDHSSDPTNPLRALDNFKIHLELYTPTFEEQSYIWGSLGGKQRPSAIYKVSVIQVESDAILSQAGAIGESGQNLNRT